MPRDHSRTPKHVERRVMQLWRKGLPRWKIAGATGLSLPTISRIARRHGERRPSGAEPKFSTEEAIRLTVELGSMRKAAEHLGVCHESVCRRLRGKKIPGLPQLDKRGRYGFRYTDEERSRALAMYADPDVPVDTICATIGCNQTTLREWAIKAGVPTRPEGARRKVDPDVARELYAKYGTYSDVAFVLEVDPQTVSRAVRGL